MLMFGIYKMASGSQCLLSCASIVLQLMSAGLQKVRLAEELKGFKPGITLL